MNLPVAYECQVPGQYNNLTWTDMLPYSRSTMDDVAIVIKEYGVQLPDIIDRSMGKSICQLCGSIYAGYQERCTHKGYFWAPKESYRSWKYVSREAALRNSDYHATPIYDICNSGCKWSLADEFQKQQKMFSFLASLRYLKYEQESDPCKEFASLFPPGVAAEVSRMVNIRNVALLKQELEMHRMAIKEIVSRMQAAGNVLSIGGF